MEIKLNNISFDNFKTINIVFPKDKISSLIGDNESGKTELLELLCGLKKIKNGSIEYNNKIINLDSNNKSIEEIKTNIYYLKENREDMLFNINVKEDIKYYVGNVNEEKLFELLNIFNLEKEILNKVYFELSSSERTKILIIVGLITNAKIIIFDNPTIKLDNKSIQTFIKCLKKLKREEKTIIISSYNTDFLLEISDNIIVLDNKKIIAQGTKYDILSNAKLLNKANASIPNIIEFVNKVRELKQIKLNYTDNINDLIKDVYRHAK